MKSGLGVRYQVVDIDVNDVFVFEMCVCVHEEDFFSDSHLFHWFEGLERALWVKTLPTLPAR